MFTIKKTTTCATLLMESHKVLQAGCMRSVHPGVGVEPGGFTSPGGGGATLHRLEKRIGGTFYEVTSVDGLL